MESTIDHASGAAAVNAPATTTIYAPDGEAVQVQSDRVETWIRKGYSLTNTDPALLLADFKTAWKAAAEPVDAFVKAVQADGHIDAGDQAALATAQAGLEHAVQAFNRLLTAVQATYPVKQGETVTMAKDGVTIDIDPNQVDQYRAEGYRKQNK